MLLGVNTHVLRAETESTKPPAPIHRCPKPPQAHLPFLMVSRPSNGPSTGSTDSSRFSIKTRSPAARACSSVSRYLWETALVPPAAEQDVTLPVRRGQKVVSRQVPAFRERRRGKVVSVPGAESGTDRESPGCPTERMRPQTFQGQAVTTESVPGRVWAALSKAGTAWSYFQHVLCFLQSPVVQFILKQG